MVVGYDIYLLQDWFEGWRYAFAAVVPVVGIGVLYGLAWPTWIVMNT
jgi:hypothetical protein